MKIAVSITCEECGDLFFDDRIVSRAIALGQLLVWLALFGNQLEQASTSDHVCKTDSKDTR